MTDKIFVSGMIVKRKDTAPSYVVASVAVKLDEFYEFAKTKTRKGWLNLDIKVSREGKYYAELDTWLPESEKNVENVKDRIREQVEQAPDEPKTTSAGFNGEPPIDLSDMYF